MERSTKRERKLNTKMGNAFPAGASGRPRTTNEDPLHRLCPPLASVGPRLLRATPTLWAVVGTAFLDGRRGREHGGDAHHRGHYNGGKQQADYTRCELVDRHLAVSPQTRRETAPRSCHPRESNEAISWCRLTLFPLRPLLALCLYVNDCTGRSPPLAPPGTGSVNIASGGGRKLRTHHAHSCPGHSHPWYAHP